MASGSLRVSCANLDTFENFPLDAWLRLGGAVLTFGKPPCVRKLWVWKAPSQATSVRSLLVGPGDFVLVISGRPEGKSATLNRFSSVAGLGWVRCLDWMTCVESMPSNCGQIRSNAGPSGQALPQPCAMLQCIFDWDWDTGKCAEMTVEAHYFLCFDWILNSCQDLYLLTKAVVFCECCVGILRKFSIFLTW